jgi:hypothetical protein
MEIKFCNACMKQIRLPALNINLSVVILVKIDCFKNLTFKLLLCGENGIIDSKEVDDNFDFPLLGAMKRLFKIFVV